MKLLIDPLLQAHCPDAFDVAGSRAKAQTIERLQDGLVLGQPLNGQTLHCFRGFGCLALVLLVSSSGQIWRGKGERREKDNRYRPCDSILLPAMWFHLAR